MDDLVVGCKLTVQKDNSILHAEILSIQIGSTSEDTRIYVHYEGYNKRLDEWVYFLQFID